METTFKKVDEIIKGEYCPLPLEIIPNYMGINLCSVDAVSWQKQSDGQLTSLTIHFIPADKSNDESTWGRDLTTEQKEEMDLCVSCGCETVYPKHMHINYRINYIEGAGQLCQKCADDIYKKNI